MVTLQKNYLHINVTFENPTFMVFHLNEPGLLISSALELWQYRRINYFNFIHKFKFHSLFHVVLCAHIKTLDVTSFKNLFTAVTDLMLLKLA